MTGFLRYARDAAVIGLIVFALFELTLRLLPSLIPTNMLVFFNDSLRTQIAEQVGLTLETDTRELTRDDGGPELRTYKPTVTIENRFTDVGTQAVTVDEQGFCNSEASPYDRDSISLITIGDSFTFCTTSDPAQTWTAELQESLAVDAYNLGSPAKGLYEYLQILKTYGLKKNPDVVIMAVYEGNDLRDAVRYHAFKDNQGVQAKKSASDCGQGKVCRLYMSLLNSRLGNVSYAFNTALVSVRLARGAGYNKAASLEALPDFTYYLDAEGVEQVVMNPHDTDVDEVLHAQRLLADEISLAAFDQALNDFTTLAQAYAFTPVILYIPSAHTAYAEVVTFADPEVGDEVAQLSTAQRSYFAAKTDEIGIQFIDVTESIQVQAKTYLEKEILLYYPENVHLTNAGHRLVAEIVTDALQ